MKIVRLHREPEPACDTHQEQGNMYILVFTRFHTTICACGVLHPPRPVHIYGLIYVNAM